MSAECIYVGDVYEPTFHSVADETYVVLVDGSAGPYSLRVWAIGNETPATLEVASLRWLTSKDFRLVKRGDGEKIR